MIYDLVIIGGGAAGLTCGNLAKRKGLKFVILEANKRVGKKILATGNGKCNLSNMEIDSSFYNNEFVNYIIQKYPPQRIIEFFDSLGMKTKLLGKRVYPYTESSNTVLNFLMKDLEKDIVCNYLVKSIEKQKYFIINNEYKALNVVLATGSNATLGYNSLNLLDNFGHKYRKFTPSLVSLITDKTYIKGLSGLRAKVKAKLFNNEKIVAEEEGELLFKDNGISGIVVFMLSAFIARQKGSYRIVLDFAEDLTQNEIQEYSLQGLVRDNLAKNIRQQAQDKKQSVEYTLKNFEIEKVSLGNLKNAQVCSGGYLTKDFDEKSLQSKLVEGLYAVGETLDIDGQCGGYNLHWAWASAMAAVIKIRNKKEERRVVDTI